jgi:hypothetical protein
VATVALYLQGAVASELDLLVGVVIDLVQDLAGSNGARDEWGACQIGSALREKIKREGSRSGQVRPLVRSLVGNGGTRCVQWSRTEARKSRGKERTCELPASEIVAHEIG